MSTEIELPLPAPDMPMVARLISEAIDKKEQSLIWALAQTHPLADNFKIVRMFIVSEPDGVEIYSVSSDAKTGMRDRIPWSRIVIVGEVMPTLDVFVDELAAAEGEGDDGDEEVDTPDSPPAPTVVTSNGQPAS